nr:serine:threonine protein phosphatase 2A [Hymenolepis microstoma]
MYLDLDGVALSVGSGGDDSLSRVHLSHCKRFSRVNIDDFFAFVKKTVCLQQTRISLSNYDRRGDGYLQEDDLEAYVTNLIPSLCHLICQSTVHFRCLQLVYLPSFLFILTVALPSSLKPTSKTFICIILLIDLESESTGGEIGALFTGMEVNP